MGMCENDVTNVFVMDYLKKIFFYIMYKITPVIY